MSLVFDKTDSLIDLSLLFIARGQQATFTFSMIASLKGTDMLSKKRELQYIEIGGRLDSGLVYNDIFAPHPAVRICLFKELETSYQEAII